MNLNPEQIEVGRQYVLVEAPLYKAVVTVLENLSYMDYVGWKVRIDHAEGLITPKIGEYIDVGWNQNYSQYTLHQFYPNRVELKEVGA